MFFRRNRRWMPLQDTQKKRRKGKTIKKTPRVLGSRVEVRSKKKKKTPLGYIKSRVQRSYQLLSLIEVNYYLPLYLVE